MPELPEVETVRQGLVDHVLGRRVVGVEVLHPRAVRRMSGGADELVGRLRGATLRDARRRGKYLWIDIDHDGVDPSAAVIHLGMSGQLLIAQRAATDHTHLRVRLSLDDATELRFVDQRTFGGWHLDDYSADPATHAITDLVPATIAHIAPDPFESVFDPGAVIARMRTKHSEIKRILLDQSVISGVGNIYADEALWRSRLHGTRSADGISRTKLAELLGNVSAVMGEALAVGGTSFDALYVNINGQSGYFERSLDAYGRAGQPCRRCGTVMRRESFMNRSSFFCPVCQRRR